MSISRALSIGNFDGVHRGHQALIDAARAAVGQDGRVVILTFDPHPRTVLRPDEPHERLSGFAERRAALTDAGADEVVRLQPDRMLLALDPDAFIAEVVATHRPDVVVEGLGFRFGRDRSGSIETLRALADRHGFRVVTVDPVEASLSDHHLVTVSSSMIRWMLARGRVRDAARLLGRPYTLHAEVVRGDQRGRTIGVPTANLARDDRMLPADGIYAGRARHPDAGWFPAAISVGTKPTFGAHPRTCEAHLLGFDGPLDEYGWAIDLEFTDWLRSQIRYDDVATLVTQLGRDIEQVRTRAVLVADIV